jgi:hypothetical protein
MITIHMYQMSDFFYAFLISSNRFWVMDICQNVPEEKIQKIVLLLWASLNLDHLIRIKGLILNLIKENPGNHSASPFMIERVMRFQSPDIIAQILVQGCLAHEEAKNAQ